MRRFVRVVLLVLFVLFCASHVTHAQDGIFESQNRITSGGIAPNAVAGLAWWHKADVITGETNGNDLTAPLQDQSTNDNDASSSGAAYPRYVTGGLITPAWQVEVGDSLGLTSGVTLSASTGFVVISLSAVGGVHNIFSGTADNSLVWRIQAGKQQLVRIGTVLIAESTTTLAANTPYALAYSYDGTTVKFYVDGVETDSISASFPISAATDFVGATDTNASLRSEHFVFTSVISAANRNGLFTYLCGRFSAVCP